MSIKKFTDFDQYIKNASGYFNLLSDPNRLSVMVILTYGDCTVSGIFKCLQLKQNLISHHLKTLYGGGLVRRKRRGREIYYSLNEQTMVKMQQAIHKFKLKN